MKLTLVFIVSAALAPCALGLSCYSCTETLSTLAGNCFKTSSQTRVNSCESATGTYCRTTFTLEDGITTSVKRGCITGTLDEVSISSSVPTANKCITSLTPSGSNPTDKTNCYYHCTTNNCNTATITILKTCFSDCSRSLSQGTCNYITGTCVCNDGYTGSDCSNTIATTTPTYRSCIQCNSETDTGCSTSTSGSTCPANQKYCSSAQTMTFDLTSSKNPVRTIITRGCTSSWLAVDECVLTNIYNYQGFQKGEYTEYTCYSTCSSDNCNTKIPDGVVDGSEKKVIHCRQCNSTNRDCTNRRTPCPSSSTHCKATVVYFISPKADLNYEAPPEHRIVRVVRECASKAVTPKCTEVDMTDTKNLKKVTCQETCQTDGCNSGWPARPKCLQCSTKISDYFDGYDVCLENPGPAQSCLHPYHKYCYTSDIGPRDGNQGYSRRIERGCSYYNRGSGCTSQTLRDVSVQQCNYTCSSDGCNVGNGGTIPMHNLVAAVVAVILGCKILDEL